MFMVRDVFVSKIVKNMPKRNGAGLPACLIFPYRPVLKICVKITVFSDMRKICFRKKQFPRDAAAALRAFRPAGCLWRWPRELLLLIA